MKQFLLPLAALLTAWPMQGAVPAAGADAPKRMHGAHQRVVAPVPSATARAWMVRDRASLPLGLVSFRLDEPASMTSLFALADKAYAGVSTPDGYYFYRFRDNAATQDMQPLAWSKVDPATGVVTNIADWSDKAFIFNDMAYDYSTNTIYAIAREYYVDDFLTALQFEYSALYRVDASTGVATRIKQFINWETGAINNPTYITLTADLEGNLYAVDSYGYLVTFDRDNDWEERVIGDTGRRPAMRLQTMDYDPVSGKIFWAADYQSALADLCMIDPLTATTHVTGLLGNDSRLAGLAIDYRVPSAGAPAGVTDLTATAAADGAGSADISFTLPTRSFSNSALTSISGVTVQRNSAPVITRGSSQPGQQITCTDASAGTGFSTYTVTASNALGEGLARSVTIWTGHDVPDTPKNVGIGRNDDGSAILVWDAPDTGMHGGWIDTEAMKYDVTRLPDRTLVAKDLTDTTFTDHSIVTMGSYSYIVTPHTPDGTGAEATSVTIELGNAITVYPYNCLFDNQSVFDTWTVLNPNGGSAWQWKRRGLADYDCFAMYPYDNARDADDYLVSPALYMKPGAVYEVKFNYRGSNASHVENFEVMFGNAPTVDAMTQSLKQYTLRDGDGRFDTVTLPQVEQAGAYHVAFHATSQKGMYNIYITDITITETGGETPGPGPDPENPFKSVTDLQAHVDIHNGNVTLSWNHDKGTQTGGGEDDNEGMTTPIEEDWESYADWTLNPSGSVAWTYVDGDKGIPYRSDYADMPYPTDGAPLAAMIMAPYQLSSEVYDANPPHGGQKYLLFKSNFSAADGSRPAPVADDYLISPKLNYSADFVFSFWCKADPDFESQQSGFWGNELWNHEEYRVGYSLTGNSPADFIWTSGANESVTSMGTSWVKKEYSIPADAKYVAINYCTPENGFWFMVDDIYIGLPRAGAPMHTEAQTATFAHYDVTLDGDLIASTPATSHTVEGLLDGLYTATVTAVYDEGQSEPAELQFWVRLVGVDEVETSITGYWPNPASDMVHFTQIVDKAEVVDMNGRIIASASQTDSMSLHAVPAGIYLIRIHSGELVQTGRLIVK